METARAYERASDHLSKTIEDYGQTTTVSDSLAFEIKLKAIAMTVGSPSDFGHRYHCGWRGLPEGLQKRLKKAAAIRYSGHTNFDDMQSILLNISRAFVKYRYAYEINESRTPEEIAIASENWDDPDFQFHPLEIKGLSEAIEAEIEKWLASNPW